jgi:hypothetical protein
MTTPHSPNEFLSPNQPGEIDKRISGHLTAGREVEAWEVLQEMLPAASRQQYVPGLCEAAGLDERAAVEQRRMNSIEDAQK